MKDFWLENVRNSQSYSCNTPISVSSVRSFCRRHHPWLTRKLCAQCHPFLQVLSSLGFNDAIPLLSFFSLNCFSQEVCPLNHSVLECPRTAASVLYLAPSFLSWSICRTFQMCSWLESLSPLTSSLFKTFSCLSNKHL